MGEHCSEIASDKSPVSPIQWHQRNFNDNQNPKRLYIAGNPRKQGMNTGAVQDSATKNDHFEHESFPARTNPIEYDIKVELTLGRETNDHEHCEVTRGRKSNSKPQLRSGNVPQTKTPCDDFIDRGIKLHPIGNGHPPDVTRKLGASATKKDRKSRSQCSKRQKSPMHNDVRPDMVPVHGVYSNPTVRSIRTQTVSLPCDMELAPFDEVTQRRADGYVQFHEGFRVRKKAVGCTIPYRADHEPPPLYTRPPPTLPCLLEEQVEIGAVHNLGTIRNARPDCLETRQYVCEPSGVFGGTSGEMVLTRTPRNASWQEACQQLRRANQSRPVSADTYTFLTRGTVNCEYTVPVIGQRPPLPHVHVQQNSSNTYRQYLYPNGEITSHYLWKKVDGQAGYGDKRFWNQKTIEEKTNEKKTNEKKTNEKKTNEKKTS